jgi:hypothetical protein
MLSLMTSVRWVVMTVCRIDDGVAAEHRLFAVGLFDPHGGQAEGGFDGLFAGQADVFAAGSMTSSMSGRSPRPASISLTRTT